MTRCFFGPAFEQFPPESLLRQAVLAERAGFDGISCSDHLQPWWEGGEGAATWPTLGAMGQATERVPLGTGVTPTAARYHPVLIAQAWMTLERLNPGRMFLGLGSGEALNEVPVGDDWPSPAGQVARMDEAIGYIQRLWAGETITEEGRFYRLRDARLHTLAERTPPLWVSAFGPAAAEVAGRRGDALWTLPDPESTPEVLDAYRAARREAGREGDGEIVFQALFSWAETDAAALEAARPWKGAQPEQFFKEEWHIPRAMYAEGEEELSDEAFMEKAIIGADPAHHAERIRALADMGATVVVLQNCSAADPERAIEVYGKQVLPRVREG
jgi:coenzyme F420-dependent glucose-6-phosphate dehydrogenase